MHDAVTPRAITAAGADLLAGYDDGQWPDADELEQLYPGKTVVRITVWSSDNEGIVADVENGDMLPGDAVGWVQRRRAAGADPTVYCSLSMWSTLQATFQAAGVPEPHWWVANWVTTPITPPAGAVAVQWGHDMGSGYDTSTVLDYWPGVDPAPEPPPVTDVGDNVKVIAIPLFTTDANGWFATDVTLPTGATKTAIVSVPCDAASPFDTTPPGGPWWFCSGEPDYLPNTPGKARVVFQGSPNHQFTARVFVAVP